MTHEHDGPNGQHPSHKEANQQEAAQQMFQKTLDKRYQPHYGRSNPHDGNGSPNPHPTNDDTDWANTDPKYVNETITCLKKQFAEEGIKTLAELDIEIEQANKANGTNEVRPLVSGAWNCENCSLAKAQYELPLWKFIAQYFDDITVSEMAQAAQGFIAQQLGGVAVHGDEHAEDSFGQANGYIAFNTKRVKAQLYATWWQTAFKSVRGQPDTPDYSQGIMGAGNMRADVVIERTDLITGEVDYIDTCHDHSMLDPSWAPGRQDDPEATSPIRLAQNHERAKLIKELRDQGRSVHHVGDKNTLLGKLLGDKDTAPLTEIAGLHLAGDPRGENRWTQAKGERIDGLFVADDTEVVEYNVFLGGTNAANSFRHSWDDQTTLQKAKALKQDLDDIKSPDLVGSETFPGDKALTEMKLAADAILARLIPLGPTSQSELRSHDQSPDAKPVVLRDHALIRFVLRRKKPAA